MKKKDFHYLTAVIGLLLLASGMILLHSGAHSNGILLVLPYVCIGFGCGAFGHGFSDIINNKVMENNPHLQKQMEIDKNDERNIAISNKAKAKAFDLMLYVFGALMVSFALMGMEITAVLLLVAIYLFVVGFFLFYLNKYHKEM